MARHEGEPVTRAVFRVLIIENDPTVRSALSALLKGQGYRLVEAATAARAVIEARSYRPDLLLVDLDLPDADGIVVIRRVRTWSTVPILALSSANGEEQKVAALDAGADDHIAKPFSAAELLARVRAGLVAGRRVDSGRRGSSSGVYESILHAGTSAGPGERSISHRCSTACWTVLPNSWVEWSADASFWAKPGVRTGKRIPTACGCA